jgi:hypothetical protein
MEVYGQVCSMQENDPTSCKSLLGADTTAVCGTVYDVAGVSPFTHDGVREMEDINFAIPTFDSFSHAFVTIFQVLTLEGWSTLLYNYQDAGDTVSATIFFSCVVMIGALFSMNLFLASIMESFSKQ